MPNLRVVCDVLFDDRSNLNVRHARQARMQFPDLGCLSAQKAGREKPIHEPTRVHDSLSRSHVLFSTFLHEIKADAKSVWNKGWVLRG